MNAPATLPGIIMASANINPAIGIYGDPGVGKTSLAASIPSVVFLQTEPGIPAGITVPSFGMAMSFSAVMAAMAELYTAAHPYKALAVDSISALQPLVWEETCRRGDVNGSPKLNIEGFGYGKGYVLALSVWAEFIEGLEALRRDRGMMIVLIAHSTIRKFADPESTVYDRHELDLHEKAASQITRWLDAVLLLKRPAIIRTEDAGFNRKRSHAEPLGNAPVIHTVASPAFIAKNRLGMPPVIRFEQGKGFEALAPFLPGFSNPTATEKEK